MPLILLLFALLPFIVSTIGSSIACDYQTYGTSGCPPESHMICKNTSNSCECNASSEYRIRFGDQCLAMKTIDENCLISDQCIKTEKMQLFCYHLESNREQFIKLNTSVAIGLRQRLNRTQIDGFCRCDDSYYYDYEQNRCLHLNSTPEFDLELNAMAIDEYVCTHCSTIDENSYCDRTDKSCHCKDGFLKGSYGKCVPKRQLYERCSHSDECIVSNSYCEPIVEQCVCNYGYIEDQRKRLCLKSRGIYDKCAEQRECNYLFGFCDPNKAQCLCDSNSVLLNKHSPSCAKRTSYGQWCDPQMPDQVCAMTVEHSICNRYTNRCVCENGYIFMSTECQKIDINRFGFGDDLHESDANKNPMTYIVIVFCTVFGFTIFASILIKIFRRPFTRTQLALYDINNRLTNINVNPNEPLPPRAPPTAPPVYTESPALRDSSQTIHSHNRSADSEDKPPSYEEAVSGQYVAIN